MTWRLWILALLASCVGCASHAPCPPMCISQDNATLTEIASGQLELRNPATAAWERRVALACGWMDAADYRDDPTLGLDEDVADPD